MSNFIRITIIRAGHKPEEETFLYKKKTNSIEHAKSLDDFTVKNIHEKPNEYVTGAGAHAVRSRIERVLQRLKDQAKPAEKFKWLVEYVSDLEVRGTPAGPGSASVYAGGLKMKAKY